MLITMICLPKMDIIEIENHDYIPYCRPIIFLIAEAVSE